MEELTAHKSLTALTYERIRMAIVTARYKPGEKLRIDSLKKEFDASIGAVREALARLTSEGLVTAEPQKGFMASLISRKELTDLTDARVIIEQICLESSMRNGDIAWEGRVLSIAHQLTKLEVVAIATEDREVEWHRCHEKFHDELTSGCANDCWLKLRRQLYVQSERYRRLSGPFGDTDRDVAAEHRAIVDAVLERDVDKAKQLMASHLRLTAENLLKSEIPFSAPLAPAYA
ncbi:MAG: GntR family transcriptional regulator [Rhizobiaceae bacterium MnEN-MB40S]|nr:MAG: GntR family transcriptional regulator [Rhizobiaceae bacterium MnEN-MB40S]